MNKLETAIISLIRSRGLFYSLLLQRMEKQPSKAIPATAVSIKNNNIYLQYNEELFNIAPLDFLEELLAHECEHIVRCVFSRCKTRDPKIFNLAQDALINSNLQIKRPRIINNTNYTGITCSDFTQFGVTENLSTEEVYDKICKNNPKRSNIDLCSWKEINNQQILEQLKSIIKEVSKQSGNIPSHLQALIESGLRTKLNWPTILRNFIISCSTPTRYSSYLRPNRRFLELKGKKFIYNPTLAFWVDTSGSVSDKQLQAFFSELDVIARLLNVKLFVGECDCKVTKTFWYTQKLKYSVKDICSRGGTSFIPPFEYMQEKHLKFDGVIYFTDLMGHFPPPPRYPTLWINTGDKEAKAPFGKTIYLDV